MSDLRDFTPSSSTGNSPRFIDEPFGLNQPVRDDIVIVDDGGLGDMHIRSDVEEEGTSRNKLFAGLAVAVLVGIGGAYGVSQYIAGQPVVADSRLPQPSAPSQTAAMTPPPAAPAPDATAPDAMTTPAAPDVVKPAPVTRQAARANATKVAPMPVEAAPAPQDAVSAPAQNQAINTVPDPVSPTPPASAVAGNPALNQQSAEPAQAPVDAAPQAAIPAPVDAAPAPATPAEPAAASPAEPAATSPAQ